MNNFADCNLSSSSPLPSCSLSLSFSLHHSLSPSLSLISLSLSPCSSLPLSLTLDLILRENSIGETPTDKGQGNLRQILLFRNACNVPCELVDQCFCVYIYLSLESNECQILTVECNIVVSQINAHSYPHATFYVRVCVCVCVCVC